MVWCGVGKVLFSTQSLVMSQSLLTDSVASIERSLTHVDPNRKYSVFKHKKKQAANESQLLMNRIALLQKEEERARKKIEKTKTRAVEILALRDENEKRIKEWIAASTDDEAVKKKKAMANKEFEERSRRARADRNNKAKEANMSKVTKMKEEKKSILKEIIRFENSELKKNQDRRGEVKRQEELAKLRREKQKQDEERKVREAYEMKAANEAAEAKRAEKLVKALEKKEREWIAKLKEAQMVQENAFGYLETALTRETASAGIEDIRKQVDKVSVSSTSKTKR